MTHLNGRYSLTHRPTGISRKRVAIAFRARAPEVNVGQGRETVQDRASSHICQLAGMAESEDDKARRAAESHALNRSSAIRRARLVMDGSERQVAEAGESNAAAAVSRRCDLLLGRETEVNHENKAVWITRQPRRRPSCSRAWPPPPPWSRASFAHTARRDRFAGTEAVHEGVVAGRRRPRKVGAGA